MLLNATYDRYQRQTRIKGFGEAAQQLLLQASVLVVGAGGLGCPALQYLCGAGVGRLGIVDDDQVTLSNLHRQPLYVMADIGLSKAVQAAKRLQALNPDTVITVYEERLTTRNALAILGKYDVVIDGSDNFSTRYLVNDACVLLKKPLVYGAVSQFEGQVAVFNAPADDGSTGINYRDLFPTAPAEGSVLNCAEAGVLGVLPGIIGAMQANETIKLITGFGKALTNSLFTYNALTNQTFEVLLSPRPGTRDLIPASAAVFEQQEYEVSCSTERITEIEPATFNEWSKRKDVVIIDVREPGEMPRPTSFSYRQMPLSALNKKIHLVEEPTILVFCQSGKRSLIAGAQLLKQYGASKNIFSLKGGIVNWEQHSATNTAHAGTQA